jgi:hypothetical protein
MIQALYANTWDGLTVKMLGYYHDHCHHYYTGTCDDLPEKYKKFRKNNVKYVFIYEEDEPYKPNENE